ncbi:MAG: hypothetical protein Q4F71_13230 [Paracoccus sp. (in: a-proteobacteria)]|nr:hypothetical protein [Paracoccus sp. (in: a-proteobacteria)]
MIGVVIWSSRQTSKAVIWCEDQGALAYASPETGREDDMDWPEPGDLIGLDAKDGAKLREVTQMWLVTPRAFPQLPAALLGETNRPASQLSLVSSQNVPRQLQAAQSDRAVQPVNVRAAESRASVA